MIKVREDGTIKNKAVYLALGVNMEGRKELLGMYIAETEGAKFWLNVLTQLHNRGIQDILIACMDGLKGFPEAIRSVFPNTQVQSCFEYTEEIRKVIYTTNAIESLNRSLRKTLKTKGVFPNDDSVFKILYLSLKRISRHWTMPIPNWKMALNQLEIRFGDRIHF